MITFRIGDLYLDTYYNYEIVKVIGKLVPHIAVVNRINGLKDTNIITPEDIATGKMVFIPKKYHNKLRRYVKCSKDRLPKKVVAILDNIILINDL